MKDNSFAIVAQKASQISNNSNQHDKDRALIENAMQLRPNDWPKLKKNHKLNKMNSQQTPIKLPKNIYRKLQKSN